MGFASLSISLNEGVDELLRGLGRLEGLSKAGEEGDALGDKFLGLTGKLLLIIDFSASVEMTRDVTSAFNAINGVKGFNGGGNTSGKNPVYLVNPV